MISIEKLLLKRFIIVVTIITVSLGVLNHWWAERIYLNVLTQQLEHESEALLKHLQKTKPNNLSTVSLNLPQHSSHLYYIESSASSWSSAPELISDLPIKTWLNTEGIYQYEKNSGENFLLLSKRHTDGFNLIVMQDITASLVELEKSHLYMLLVVILSFALLMYLQRKVIRETFSKINPVYQQIEAIQRGEKAKLIEPNIAEISPLAKAINQLLGYLESRNERSKNAIGNLSHALKTPVAVIRQIIEQNDSGLSTENRLRLTDQIDQLNFIINGELKRARISGRGSQKQSFSLSDTVNNLSSTLTLIYPDKKIDFILKISEKAYFPGDKSDFLELLGNLMDNAAKWCAHQVTIEISMQSGMFNLQVVDDGPGYNESDIPSILERGVRLDEQAPGHGLGLNIVSNIVQQYIGQLQISNAVPHGCRVKIRIPLDFS